VAGELVVEALILCTVGGVIGVLVGAFVCNTLSSALNPLTLPFHIADVQWLFPTTTLLSFGATSVVAVYYASKPDTGTQY
jgi:ABC-type antimicrobial peptide transport system permease subunit